MTRIPKISIRSLDKAADIIHKGGIVAIPTETYYGLAVDPFNRAAVHRLFTVKKRSEKLPILLLVSGVEQSLSLLKEPVADSFTLLAKKFWPASLTLVHEAKKHIPEELKGNTQTIGLRQSPHDVPAELIRRLGYPITGTSANISGHKAAVTAQQVEAFFDLGIDFILDGGKTPGISGSTLVQCSKNKVQCLREGILPYDTILETTHNPYPNGNSMEEG